MIIPDWRYRIRNRLLFAYLFPIALLFGGLSFFAYYHTKWSLDREFSRGLLSVAGSTALGVDPAAFLVLSPGDEESRVYLRLKGYLERVRDTNQLAGISLLDPGGRIVVDGRGTRIGSVFPRYALDRGPIAEALGGTGQVSILFSGPDTQLFKEAYYPLRAADSGGTPSTIGLVAVEGSAGYFESLSRLRRDLFIGALIGLAIVAVITVLLARRMVTPIYRLVEGAERIGAGELESRVEAGGRDEIGFLARTLDRMRESLFLRDRTMNLMLRGVAHEVRNPLGGMELYAGLLADRLGESDPESGYVKKIRREINNLKVAVEEFLEYARPEKLQREEVEVKPFFAEVLEVLAADAGKKRIRLVLDADGTGRFKLDPLKIRRVVLNLVSNAMIASPEGSQVNVRVLRDDSALTLAVEDRGVGIPENDLPRIFEPFFTTREKGSGIGLAMAKRAVDAHGGTVTVASRVGEGTRITVVIPEEGQDRL